MASGTPIARLSCWGEAGAPHRAVALHGFMANASTWGGVARRLQPRGWRILAPTLAPLAEASADFDSLAAAVDAVVREAAAEAETAGGELPVLLGYSMGGRIAIEYLQRYPDAPIRALVLESAGLGPKSAAERAAARERSRQWAARFLGEPPEAYVAWWESLPIFAAEKALPDPVRQKLRRMRQGVAPETLAALTIAAGQGEMRGDEASRALLAGLAGRMPVAYVAGMRDAKYAAIAASLEGLGLDVRMADAGHNVHLENPDSLCSVLCVLGGEGDLWAGQEAAAGRAGGRAGAGEESE